MKAVYKREKPVEIEKESNKKFNIIKEIYDWLDSIVVAFVAVVILLTFVFRVVSVDGTSMLDTLEDQDKVIITQLFYKPKQGDIVVLLTNKNFASATSDINRPLIKRVIAVEGQEIDIDFNAGIVYVDGAALDEPYAREPITREGTMTFPQIVPEGHVFVLGDNRNASSDSRYIEIGMVDTRYVLGHAVFRIFPVQSIGGLD